MSQILPKKRLFDSKFEILAKIGEGTYGEVFKCRNITNDAIVAIKKIKLNKDDDQGLP